MQLSHIFFIAGIVLATMATISCILAFALPSWIYTYEDDSQQGINYAGLWTFCLETFFDFRQRVEGKPCDNTQEYQGANSDGCFNDGVPMYGCHWIYSDALKEIRWTILNPVWYIVVQILATINLILTLLGIIGLYIICVVKKNKCPLIFGIISMFVCSILGLCEVVLFGLRFNDEEYYKVPNVKSKSLGAGWGMAVVACILSVFATGTLMMSYVTDEDRRAARAVLKADMMTARTSKQPLVNKPAAGRGYQL